MKLPQASLFLVFLALGQAQAQSQVLPPAKVQSTAYVSTSGAGTPQQEISTQAGASVNASGQGILLREKFEAGAPGNVRQFEVARTAMATASAQTEIGVNRVKAIAHGVVLDRATIDSTGGAYWAVNASTHTVATSASQDWLLVEGGTPGSSATVKVSGYVEYDLSWTNLGRRQGPDGWLNFSVGGRNLTTFDTQSFMASASRGYLLWSHVFNVTVGQPEEFKLTLTANLDTNVRRPYHEVTDRRQEFYTGFDASHTAVVSKFELQPGLQLRSAAGSLVALDDGWTYQASIEAGLQPVPEPATALMMGLGLLGLWHQGRRRCHTSA